MLGYFHISLLVDDDQLARLQFKVKTQLKLREKINLWKKPLMQTNNL